MTQNNYDIFIHYPINTNQDINDTTDNWALEFSRHLDNILNKLLHERPTIINTQIVDSKEKLYNEKPAQIIKNTSIFIIIDNNNSKEDSNFSKIIDEIFIHLEDNHLPVENHVFKINLQPISEQYEHDKLKEIVSYSFYEQSGLSKRVKTIDITNFSDPKDIFWERLLDLCYDLSRSIDKSKNAAQKENARLLVYLAWPDEGQKAIYNRIARELFHYGIKIYPDKKLPQDRKELNEKITLYLSKSNMSVHIFGEFYGKNLPKSEYSLVELQNKIVDEYIQENPDFNKLIFIPNNIRIRDGKQKLFIERVKKNVSAQTEIFETNITEFNDILIQRILKKDKLFLHENIKNQLYYISETSNNDFFKTLEDTCNSQNISIITTPESDSITENLNKHYKNLMESKWLVINYSNNNPVWLQTKLQDSLKVFGMGRKEKFSWKCLMAKNQISDKIPEELFTGFETIYADNQGYMDFFLKRCKEMVIT